MPLLSAVAVAVEVPVKCTVAPPVPLIVPERENKVEKLAVALALLIVIAWLAGLKVKPVCVGVTV